MERTRFGVEPAQRMAERRGDVEGLAVLRDRQSGRHPLALSWPSRPYSGFASRQEFFAVGILEDSLLRQQAVGVVEAVDPVVKAAAGEEPLAVGRPESGRRNWPGRDTRPMILPLAPSTVTISCSP